MLARPRQPLPLPPARKPASAPAGPNGRARPGHAYLDGIVRALEARHTRDAHERHVASIERVVQANGHGFLFADLAHAGAIVRLVSARAAEPALSHIYQPLALDLLHLAGLPFTRAAATDDLRCAAAAAELARALVELLRHPTEAIAHGAMGALLVIADPPVPFPPGARPRPPLLGAAEKGSLYEGRRNRGYLLDARVVAEVAAAAAAIAPAKPSTGAQTLSLLLHSLAFAGAHGAMAALGDGGEVWLRALATSGGRAYATTRVAPAAVSGAWVDEWLELTLSLLSDEDTPLAIEFELVGRAQPGEGGGDGGEGGGNGNDGDGSDGERLLGVATLQLDALIGTVELTLASPASAATPDAPAEAGALTVSWEVAKPEADADADADGMRADPELALAALRLLVLCTRTPTGALQLLEPAAAPTLRRLLRLVAAPAGADRATDGRRVADSTGPAPALVCEVAYNLLEADESAFVRALLDARTDGIRWLAAGLDRLVAAGAAEAEAEMRNDLLALVTKALCAPAAGAPPLGVDATEAPLDEAAEGWRATGGEATARDALLASGALPALFRLLGADSTAARAEGLLGAGLRVGNGAAQGANGAAGRGRSAALAPRACARPFNAAPTAANLEATLSALFACQRAAALAWPEGGAAACALVAILEGDAAADAPGGDGGDSGAGGAGGAGGGGRGSGGEELIALLVRLAAPPSEGAALGGELVRLSSAGSTLAGRLRPAGMHGGTAGPGSGASARRPLAGTAALAATDAFGRFGLEKGREVQAAALRALGALAPLAPHAFLRVRGPAVVCAALRASLGVAPPDARRDDDGVEDDDGGASEYSRFGRSQGVVHEADAPGLALVQLDRLGDIDDASRAVRDAAFAAVCASARLTAPALESAAELGDAAAAGRRAARQALARTAGAAISAAYAEQRLVPLAMAIALAADARARLVGAPLGSASALASGSATASVLDGFKSVSGRGSGAQPHADLPALWPALRDSAIRAEDAAMLMASLCAPPAHLSSNGAAALTTSPWPTATAVADGSSAAAAAEGGPHPSHGHMRDFVAADGVSWLAKALPSTSAAALDAAPLAPWLAALDLAWATLVPAARADGTVASSAAHRADAALRADARLDLVRAHDGAWRLCRALSASPPISLHMLLALLCALAEADAALAAELAASELNGRSFWCGLARLWTEEEARHGLLRARGGAHVGDARDALAGDMRLATSVGARAGAFATDGPAGADACGPAGAHAHAALDEEGDPIERVALALGGAPAQGGARPLGGAEADVAASAGPDVDVAERVAIGALLRGPTTASLALRGLSKAPLPAEPRLSRPLAARAQAVDNRKGLFALAVAVRRALGAAGSRAFVELAGPAASAEEASVLRAMEAYEHFAQLGAWTELRERMEAEGTRPTTADRERLAVEIATRQTVAAAVSDEQAATLQGGEAAAEAQTLAQTRFISAPTEGHGIKPKRRTFTESLRTRARVDEMLALSFSGYGGSLAALNHTIGASAFPRGDGGAASARDLSPKRTRATITLRDMAQGLTADDEQDLAVSEEDEPPEAGLRVEARSPRAPVDLGRAARHAGGGRGSPEREVCRPSRLSQRSGLTSDWVSAEHSKLSMRTGSYFSPERSALSLPSRRASPEHALSAEPSGGSASAARVSAAAKQPVRSYSSYNFKQQSMR